MPHLASQKGFAPLILLLLIIISILGIFLGLWYFKFISFTAQTSKAQAQIHSLVRANPKEPIEVKAGDTLSGKAIPRSNIEIYLLPSSTKSDIKVNEKGEWSYQLPSNLDKDNYILTVTNSDVSGKQISVTAFKLKLQKNKSVMNLNVIKEAKAIEGSPGTDYDWNRLLGEDWADWILLWNQAGICPAIDDEGQIIYLNKENYDLIYGPAYKCMIHESLDAWLDEIKTDNQFFIQLYVKLNTDGWPEESFIDYFPDWKKFLDQNREVRFNSIPKSAYKHYGEKIDEETLTNYINEIAYKSGFRDKSSLLKVLINADPILGTRAMYNVYYGYKFTNKSDYVDAILGLLAFIPARAVDRTSYKLSIESYQAEKAAALMAKNRQAIREGKILTEYNIKPSFYTRRVGGQSESKFLAYLRDNTYNSIYSIPRQTGSLRFFHDYIAPALQDKQGFQIPKESLEIISQRYLNVFNTLEQITGRAIPNKMRIVENIKNAKVYVVEGRYLPIQYENDGGTTGDLTFISRTSFDNPISPNFSIYHEIVHQATEDIPGVGFTYGGNDRMSHIFTGVLEFTTDWWADIALENDLFKAGTVSGTYGYIRSPEYGYIIEAVYNRILVTNPNLRYDLLEFTLTKDTDRLLETISQNDLVTKYFTDIIDSPQTPRTANLDRFIQYFQGALGITLSAVTYYTANEQLNHNVKFGDNYISDPTLSRGNADVTITSVQGEVKPGGSLNVTAVASANGSSVDYSNYREVWSLTDASGNSISYEPSLISTAKADFEGELPETLREVDPLRGGNNCDQSCIITLPTFLNTEGGVQLSVFLTKEMDSKVLAGDSYPIPIDHNTTTKTDDITSCSETEMIYDGCNENVCGEEYWRCPKDNKLSPSVPNPNGDCSVKGGPNPACKDKGQASGTGSGSTLADEEGNKIPFFGIMLGSDDKGSIESIRNEANIRIAEMKDFGDSLNALSSKVSDPKLKELINLTNEQLNNGSKEVRACLP